MQERSITPRLFRHPDGITAVDTEYLHPGHAASHIVQHGGRAAFVDVGTNDSVPYLLAGLDALGIARESVDYLLLTHVHLDHAGGAGRLMQELPNAAAVLHPRGAPHMIDPEKLIVGARMVYGAERFRQYYGDLVPITGGAGPGDPGRRYVEPGWAGARDPAHAGARTTPSGIRRPGARLHLHRRYVRAFLSGARLAPGRVHRPDDDPHAVRPRAGDRFRRSPARILAQGDVSHAFQPGHGRGAPGGIAERADSRSGAHCRAERLGTRSGGGDPLRRERPLA